MKVKDKILNFMQNLRKRCQNNYRPHSVLLFPKTLKIFRKSNSGVEITNQNITLPMKENPRRTTNKATLCSLISLTLELTAIIIKVIFSTIKTKSNANCLHIVATCCFGLVPESKRGSIRIQL